MSQFNLFTGEPEEDNTCIEDVTPPPPPEPPKKSKKRGKKSFEVRRCKRCDQLIMTDPDNDRDNDLCEACDPRLKNQFDKFHNFALEKALRIHKYL